MRATSLAGAVAVLMLAACGGKGTTPERLPRLALGLRPCLSLG
jgi:hypothetical protein